MSRIFWDTNLFIYLFEGSAAFGGQVASLREKMLRRGDRLVTSTLTLGEVLVKPIKEGDTKLLKEYADVLPAVAVLCLRGHIWRGPVRHQRCPPPQSASSRHSIHRPAGKSPDLNFKSAGWHTLCQLGTLGRPALQLWLRPAPTLFFPLHTIASHAIVSPTYAKTGGAPPKNVGAPVADHRSPATSPANLSVAPPLPPAGHWYFRIGCNRIRHEVKT